MSRAVSPAGELLRVSRVVAVVCLGWHSIELGVNMQRMETVLDWKVVVVGLGNSNVWHFQDVILTIQFRTSKVINDGNGRLESTMESTFIEQNL